MHMIILNYVNNLTGFSYNFANLYAVMYQRISLGGQVHISIPALIISIVMYSHPIK